jgi:hypothetical protein
MEHRLSAFEPDLRRGWRGVLWVGVLPTLSIVPQIASRT